MALQDICSIVQQIGIPAAVLFYLLLVGSKNQRDMTKAMNRIKDELSNLTVGVHDVITYMKAKGGD